MIEGKTSWEFACSWYKEDEIARALQPKPPGSFTFTTKAWDEIPTDVRSPEFAKWLTHQYRLAMTKGIDLGLRAQHESR